MTNRVLASGEPGSTTVVLSFPNCAGEDEDDECCCDLGGGCEDPLGLGGRRELARLAAASAACPYRTYMLTDDTSIQIRYLNLERRRY